MRPVAIWPVMVSVCLAWFGNTARADTFLIKSEDRGQSWVDADFGPPHYRLLDIQGAPGSSVVYALTETWNDGYRVLASDDEGRNWRVLEKLTVRGSLVLGMAVEAGRPRVLYILKAEAPADRSVESVSILKTTDAGNTVSEFPAVGFDPPGGFLNGRYHAPQLWGFVAGPDNLLYASAYCAGIDDELIGCPEGPVFLRSTDGGYNWFPAFLVDDDPARRSVQKIRLHASDPSGVYVLNVWRLLRSRDAGVTWGSIHPDGCSQMLDLAIDPRDPSILFGVCNGGSPGGSLEEQGLYKSTDRGTTWQRVYNYRTGDQLVPFRHAVAMHPEDSSIIYVAGHDVHNPAFTIRRIIERSEDGGLTFTKVIQHDRPFPQFKFLVAGPSTLNTVWVGASDRFEFVFK